MPVPATPVFGRGGNADAKQFTIGRPQRAEFTDVLTGRAELAQHAGKPAAFGIIGIIRAFGPAGITAVR